MLPNKKFYLDLGQFYITNVCNFDCPGCVSFNNYTFTGYQKWEDYADVYRHWSDIVDLRKWVILGGEPFTNPTYLDWLRGISNLWPNSLGKIMTNGHYLKENNRALYDIINSTNGQVKLDIGLHNFNRRDEVMSTVHKWLRGNISMRRAPENLRQLPNFDKNWQNSYNAIKDESWPTCNTIDEWVNLPEHIQTECKNLHGLSPELLADMQQSYVITDGNGVQVVISYENYFHQGALIADPATKSFKLHNSDIKKSHDNCQHKHRHHFAHGQLYKCSQVALFKEIDQQFNLSVTNEQHNLIHAYKSGNVNMTINELNSFFESLNTPMDQCSFCPEEYLMTEITSSARKKVKFFKKQKTT
jgi:organic radical activating enzyme